MGYSKSLKTLKERVDFLAPLIRNEECQWRCNVAEERTIAYKVREALWIAGRIYPEQFPELAAAYRTFSITETGEGRVVARRGTNRVIEQRPDQPVPFKINPRGTVQAPPTLQEDTPQEAPLPPTTDDLVEAPKPIVRTPITAEGPLTLTAIIDKVQKHGLAGCPYHFPDASLPTDEILHLYKWLNSKNDYLLFWAHPTITIKAYDPELEPFAFSEEDVL